jgi:hypothetical protein
MTLAKDAFVDTICAELPFIDRAALTAFSESCYTDNYQVAMAKCCAWVTAQVQKETIRRFNLLVEAHNRSGKTFDEIVGDGDAGAAAGQREHLVGRF